MALLSTVGRTAGNFIRQGRVSRPDMSEKEDRFEGVDNAIDRVREELDETVEESKEAGSAAAREVREAIDDLEDRLANLRERKEE